MAFRSVDRDRPAGELAAEMVNAGSPASGSRDDRAAGSVCAHVRGDRQPADGVVRRLRQLRHAGAVVVLGQSARQAPRAPRARHRRQRAADDRDRRQLLDRARRLRDRAGGVRGVLRGRRRSKRRRRRDRCAARLRAARRLAWRDQHASRPPRGLVACLGGRDRRGARALTAGGRRRAASRRIEARHRACRAARRRAARRGSRGRARGAARGQAGADRALHRDALPADGPGGARRGTRQVRGAVGVVHGAGRRHRARAL